jgi:hypothetical protein
MKYKVIVLYILNFTCSDRWQEDKILNWTAACISEIWSVHFFTNAVLIYLLLWTLPHFQKTYHYLYNMTLFWILVTRLERILTHYIINTSLMYYSPTTNTCEMNMRLLQAEQQLWKMVNKIHTKHFSIQLSFHKSFYKCLLNSGFY